MINTVEKFIKEQNLSGKRILMGLSGGIDSVCLCDILSKLKDKLNFELIVIHLNHNWRKDESKSDEEFSKKFANERNLTFFSKTLPDEIKKNETTAREKRYEFFEECKEKFKADAVFLAHNKNDNIETFIYRLIKGTGPRGLLSIPKIRSFYYRPLIDVERCEIEKYVEENKISFVFDSSNKNTKYKRNLIREKILPYMKEINPNVINSISNFILVNRMNQNILDNVIKNCSIENREVFLSYEKEIQFELVNRLIENKVKNRDYKTVEKIVKFINENKSSKISLSDNLFLKVYDNKIYLVSNRKNQNKESVKLKEGLNKFGEYIISLEKVDIPSFMNEQNKYLKLDLTQNFVIRTRQKGDIIQPFGSLSTQKLKEFFIKKKVKSELREILPLIALNNEIYYISNTAQSEKTRVDIKDEKCYKILIKGSFENGIKNIN